MFFILLPGSCYDSVAAPSIRSAGVWMPFLTVHILTCHSRESKGGTNNINYSCVLFRAASSRLLTVYADSPVMVYWDTSMKQTPLMWLVSPLLLCEKKAFLQWLLTLCSAGVLSRCPFDWTGFLEYERQTSGRIGLLRHTILHWCRRRHSDANYSRSLGLNRLQRSKDLSIFLRRAQITCNNTLHDNFK